MKTGSYLSVFGVKGIALIDWSNGLRKWLCVAAWIAVSSSLLKSEVIMAQRPSEQPASERQFAALLQQLKTGDFESRLTAISILKSDPEKGLAALAAAEPSFDVEWNLQVERLRMELRELLLENQLQQFCADDGEETSAYWRKELPLWSLFENHLGRQPSVKSLYASAVESHLELFHRIEKEQVEMEDAITWILKFDRDRAEVSSGAISTALLLAMERQRWGEDGMPDRLMSEMESRLAANFRLFQVGKFASINRQLIKAWCVYRPMQRSKFGNDHSFLQLAMVCKVHEAFPKILAIAADEAMPGYARGTAMLYSISLARGKDLKEFESLLDDRSVVATPPQSNISQPKLVCTICDYALFGLAVHQGIDLQQLGFADLDVKELLKVDRNKIGFSSKLEREAAIAYWKKIQPQPEKQLELLRK